LSTSRLGLRAPTATMPPGYVSIKRTSNISTSNVVALPRHIARIAQMRSESTPDAILEPVQAARVLKAGDDCPL
jgi:hypothetical protein